jgi:hypothetical protein
MTNGDFALNCDPRDEIMRAVKAIERQLKDMACKPPWQVLYVIETNLTIIKTSVTNMPRASSN